MAFSVTSPADIVNISLGRIGYPRRVASLYDGSKAASAALDIYAQTRDAVLRMGNWNFAQSMENGTLLKSAPAGGYFDAPWDPATNPQMPWAYEYALPNNWLKTRAVRPQPGFLFDPAPTPTLFAEAFDNDLEPNQQVILTNVPNAIIVYTRRVTDPITWEADFIEGLAAALARRLAPLLASAEAAKMEGQDEAVMVGIAERTQG